HTRSKRDWSSDVCSSDLVTRALQHLRRGLILAAAASATLALNAAPQASAQAPQIQLPQIHLPGLTIGFANPAPAGTAPTIDSASAEYRAQLVSASNDARATLCLYHLDY